MIESRLGRWLPLLLAVMTGVDQWLALGSLAQSTVMAVAVLRRVTGKANGGASASPRR
jgi:hypothetical protein